MAKPPPTRVLMLRVASLRGALEDLKDEWGPMDYAYRHVETMDEQLYQIERVAWRLRCQQACSRLL